MKTPILDKLGSDPEFIPASFKEFDLQILPASALISNNKSVALNSFIGTDGHNNIGELRPRPCHNIRQHLYDIASGLIAIDEYIHRRKLINTAIYANPDINGETLAGHIHMSFFVDEPATVAALRAGRIMGMDGTLVNSLTCGMNTPPAPPPPIELIPILAAYAEQAAANELVTPLVMATTMGYLLKPFEWWIQPWHARVRRNRYYGLGRDEIRWQQDGNPITRPKLAGYAWLHFEYRTPSTWLVHPWLAYTYLALAKLTMTNWQLIQRLLTDKKLMRDVAFSSPEPGNEEAEKLFRERWRGFLSGGGRITRDATHIVRSLEMCADNREDWFSNHGKIQTEAWRGLL